MIPINVKKKSRNEMKIMKKQILKGKRLKFHYVKVAIKK